MTKYFILSRFNPERGLMAEAIGVYTYRVDAMGAADRLEEASDDYEYCVDDDVPVDPDTEDLFV